MGGGDAGPRRIAHQAKQAAAKILRQASGWAENGGRYPENMELPESVKVFSSQGSILFVSEGACGVNVAGAREFPERREGSAQARDEKQVGVTVKTGVDVGFKIAGDLQRHRLCDAGCVPGLDAAE